MRAPKECLEQLDSELTAQDKAEIKNIKPNELHYSLGRYLRNGLGLWSGSKLKTYFKKLGLFHPDDMSSIILDAFCAKLIDKPFDLNITGESASPRGETNGN